jgi:hypothetical protein
MPIDKSKFAAALLAPSKGMPPKDTAPETDDSDKAPLEGAATDLIDAVKSGDVQGVMDALEAAFRFLDQQEDATEPDEA